MRIRQVATLSRAGTIFAHVSTVSGASDGCADRVIEPPCKALRGNFPRGFLIPSVFVRGPRRGKAAADKKRHCALK